MRWRHLHEIERACRGTTFNHAHEILARLEGCFERCGVLTQNVDGFHKAAGSQNVIDIHGDIHALRLHRARHGLRAPRSLPGLSPLWRGGRA